MSKSTHLSSDFCSLLAGLAYENINEVVKSGARRLILDGLAVAMAGSRQEGPALLRSAFAAEGGPCAVIGGGFACEPLGAARMNGAAMHVLDFEAMWSPANHATSTVLPAILAAAQLSGADGRRILTAFVAGVEAQGRVRLASQMMEPRQFSFHPPGLVGPIGAAIAAGRVLGLSVLQLRHAIGIAASTCGSLMANVGSMTKALHCGNATANGLMAALLAHKGFTANDEIFDVPRGFVGSLVPRLDEDLLCGTGRPLMIESPGYAIKLFPSQYGTHFCITAALEAAAQIDDTGAIESVELTTPDMSYVNRPLPRTGLEGKFSFQYTTAVALLDRQVVIESFTDERLARQDIARLLPRITLVVLPDAPAHFENMEVALKVRLADGREIRTRCAAPRGYLTKGPPLRDDEILGKARNCLGLGLANAQVEEVIAAAQRIDALSHDEVQRLMKVLAGGEGAA